MCAPKFSIVPPLLKGGFVGDLRHHLLQLKLNNRMINGAIAVKASQNSRSLIMLVVCNEPSGLLNTCQRSWCLVITERKTDRFRKEQCKDRHDTRRHQLNPHWNSPAVVGIDIGTAVSRPAGDDRSYRPCMCQMNSFVHELMQTYHMQL